MLTPDETTDVVRHLQTLHQDELHRHDRVYGYVRGKSGVPEVPDGVGDELKDLAKLSVKNVLSIVVDSFANLAVNGFRSPDSAEDDPVWAWWQSQRLDARQADAHRPALTYGTSYAVIEPDGSIKFRTPRRLLAVYADPTVDEWPIYALETWADYSEAKPQRRGRLYDAENVYDLTLGDINPLDQSRHEWTQRVSVREHDAIAPHGAEVCPVVRFVNARDAEEVVVGEVSPLINLQRAINAVNFDRMVVSRFGAFPQRYAIGWAPSTADELARSSVARLMAFDDDQVKVGAFPAAGVEAYNSILNEMLAHVAMEAQIPVAAITGSIANLSAEALAMAEAPYQRKLAEKRESFGESWEQVFRLAGRLNGLEVRDDAEVVWADSETRSFAQVVDGIVKLVQVGLPIEEALQEIPGWSKQRVDSAKAAIRRASGRGVLERLSQLGEQNEPDATA